MSYLKVSHDQKPSTKSNTSPINRLRNNQPIYPQQQHQSITQLLESSRKTQYEEKRSTTLSFNATCELSWSHLVHAEIIAVTSAMRKNSRWSGMSVSGLNMGGLGLSMGLRGGRNSVNEVDYRNQINVIKFFFFFF